MIGPYWDSMTESSFFTIFRDPEYQGKGIGTQVLKDIMRVHKDQTLHIQYFKQNPVGKLYERLGFTINGETEFHYQMVKPNIK